MSEVFGVVDTNVKPGKQRTHTFTDDDGQLIQYTFGHNVQVEIPHRHAVRLQQIKSFQVFRKNGERLPHLPAKHPLDVNPNDVKLKDGQCIAVFEELTREALFARAVLFPGGQRFKANAKREELIRFLKGLAPIADRLAQIGDAGGDVDPDDVMSDDELDKMLSDRVPTTTKSAAAETTMFDGE